MAEERHTTAFVVGAVLGGMAGAAATLWNVPRSGAQTRALIAEQAENVLFRLTGMNEWRPDNVPPPTPPHPIAAAPIPDVAAEPDIAPSPVEPVASAPTEPVAEEESTTLPHTFRGEVLTDVQTEGDQPADVVLDGPRPAPSDR